MAAATTRSTFVQLSFMWIAIGVCVRHVECKIVRGEVNSRIAWENNGVYIAKFGFHDRSAVFRYETNATSMGKWHFYLDENWSSAVAETDCHKKLSQARFSVPVTSTEGQQFVNQWMRPHYWYVVYADDHSCDPNSPTDINGLAYVLNFLNPDSSGNAVDHFGEDERGLLMMYVFLFIMYIAGISLFAQRVLITIQKGGPMHEVLQMLSVAMAMHFTATLFMLIHLWLYKNDGEGSDLIVMLSEVLDVLAQLIMAWMLLSMSLGWTLGSSVHPIKDNKQLKLFIVIAIIDVLLVIWEQSYKESHSTYHTHESLPGLLMILLRVGLAGHFAYNLSFTMAKEKSALRRQFYQGFSFACYMWFLAFPILMLIAMVFAQYWRHRVVTIGTVSIQAVAMLLLSRQFLSRSLYWEVSTLSSTTLPFRRDRGSFGQ